MSTFQELCEAVFAGKIIQIRDNFSLPVEKWIDFTESAEQVVRRIAKHPDLVCRIKPDVKVITYRNYLRYDDANRTERDVELRVYSDTFGNSQKVIEIGPHFIKWLGDEQTVEVEL